MRIPESVKIGGFTFTVEMISHQLCVNQNEVLGLLDYDNQKIQIRDDIQGEQGIHRCLLHEIIHAITKERGIDWGDADELRTDELAKALYQVIKDNPDIFR